MRDTRGSATSREGTARREPLQVRYQTARHPSGCFVPVAREDQSPLAHPLHLYSRLTGTRDCHVVIVQSMAGFGLRAGGDWVSSLVVGQANSASRSGGLMGSQESVARQIIADARKGNHATRTFVRKSPTAREDGARRNVPVRCSKSLQISEGCVWLKEAHPLFGVEV